MGTKNNPGKYDCYAAAEPDEPMFVLLARDKVAAGLVLLWAEIRAELFERDDSIVGDKEIEKEGEQLHEAVQTAAEMIAWIATKKKKQSYDVIHLIPTKTLVKELARRESLVLKSKRGHLDA